MFEVGVVVALIGGSIVVGIGLAILMGE